MGVVLLWLSLFILSGAISPVAHWAPTDMGSSSFSIIFFAFSNCLWVSQGKNIKVVCYFLVQWTTFSLNSPPWPVHLGWPYKACLIVSELDKVVTHVGLIFCDCGSNYHTIALISHTSKVVLKILQARLQQNMDWECPDVQAGFRKGRGTRNQIANICWIIEKAR